MLISFLDLVWTKQLKGFHILFFHNGHYSPSLFRISLMEDDTDVDVSKLILSVDILFMSFIIGTLKELFVGEK